MNRVLASRPDVVTIFSTPIICKIWIAAEPRPPAPPAINTESLGVGFALSRMDWFAVNPATGTEAASSKDKMRGLTVTNSWGTQTYSAYAPLVHGPPR